MLYMRGKKASEIAAITDRSVATVHRAINESGIIRQKRKPQTAPPAEKVAENKELVELASKLDNLADISQQMLAALNKLVAAWGAE